MSFVRRLVLGSILILVLTVGILFWLAERSLRQDLVADFARGLESEARLVREALPADTTKWQVTVRRLAAQAGHRITLIGRDGWVRADSDFPSGGLPPIENHGNRPEVMVALRGQRGMDSRRSETVGRQLLYVAIPGGPGVVRIAAGLDQVDQVVSRAQQAVAGAALLSLLIGSVLALAAGRSIAKPLVEIGSAARAIADGAPPRFPRSGIPDIDSLIHALREMHRQLADRFADLRREQSESAALVESMVEGVIAADGRGHILTANDAARRMLGYGPADELPDLPELFRVKAAREVVHAVMGGKTIQDSELELDQRVVLVNARPLPTGGAVVVIHDLTDLRRLEAMRRDFVANVSHELKTPLTSISGYAETVLTDAPDADDPPISYDDSRERTPDAAPGGQPAGSGAARGRPLAAGAGADRNCRRGGGSVGLVARGHSSTINRVQTRHSRECRDRVRRRRCGAPGAHQSVRQLDSLYTGRGPHRLPQRHGRQRR